MDRSSPGMPAVVPREEFRQRQRRATAAAAARGLAGLLVAGRGAGAYDRCGDLLYLSNYYPPFPLVPDRPPHWSGRGHGILVLPAAGDPVLLVDVPYHRPDLLAVADVRVGYHLLGLLADVLREKDLADGPLGLAGADAVPWTWHAWLRRELPALRLVEAGDVVAALRRVKSPAEQAQIRRACRAGVAALDAFLAALRPGASEADAVAAALAELARQGAALVDIVVASGPHSGTYAHARMPAWDPGRVLRPGELVHVDLFGCLEGYFFDIARTAVVGGEPTPEQRRLVEGVRGAVAAVVEAIRPGVTAGELAAVGRRALLEYGLAGGAAGDRGDVPRGTAFAAFGHGMGLGWEDPWLVEGDGTPIEAGMYLAIEKTAAVPGVGGASWEEDVLVHEGGVEVVSAGGRPWW